MQVRSIDRVTFPQLAENFGADHSDHVILTIVQLTGALVLEEDELPNRTPTAMAPIISKKVTINQGLRKGPHALFSRRKMVADCKGCTVGS